MTAPLRLTKPICYESSNIWGQKRTLNVSPRTTPNVPWSQEWRWEHRPGFTVPVNSALAQSNYRNLALRCGKRALRIFEHIGVLTWFGLGGVSINLRGTSTALLPTWPPYSGRSWELWEAVRPHCVPVEGESVPWFTPQQAHYVETGLVNGVHSRLMLQPLQTNILVLDITISYPGFPKTRKVFRFPDPNLLETVCKARSPVWPPWHESVAKTASRFGWPHLAAVAGSRNREPEEVMDEWIRHRAADLAGGLMLATPGGLLAGHVTSICAGHRADYELLMLLEKRTLRRVA